MGGRGETLKTTLLLVALSLTTVALVSAPLGDLAPAPVASASTCYIEDVDDVLCAVPSCDVDAGNLKRPVTCRL